MLAQTCRQNLLAIARAYATATGATLSAVSKRYYGNGGFLRDFGAGKHSIRIDKYDEMIDGLRKDWPAGAPWPYLRAAIIERPKEKRPQISKPPAVPDSANQLDTPGNGTNGRGRRGAGAHPTQSRRAAAPKKVRKRGRKAAGRDRGRAPARRSA